jgi:hypothetical protein
MPFLFQRVRRFFAPGNDGGMLTLLGVVFLAANWPLLTGRVSERCDGATFFAPFYNYLASLARSGHFLLWNPLSNGGSPDGFEPQLGAFSPVTLLFALVGGPGPASFHFYWLSLWLLGGLGMYVLARALGAPPWGGLVTALAFVFSGFYIGQAVHLSAIYSYSFVPWIVWRVRAAMITSRRWPASEAGALWGLAGLAGNPAVHLPAIMFIALVAPAFLPKVQAGEPPWKGWRTYVETMALLALVGVAVLAPTYGGFRHEVAGYSHRTWPLPREIVLSQGYGFSWLTALLTPVFVSYRDALPGWAQFDVSMRPIYFGASLPVLAAFALWRRGGWRRWIILGAGLLCLGVAMGTTLPLRAWLYDWVPPTRFFRHPAMFRAYFILAVAMLAAMGTADVEASLQSDGKKSKDLLSLAAISGLGALLSVAAFVWMSALLTDALQRDVPPTAPLHLALSWVGLFVLWLAGARWVKVRPCLPGLLVALTALDMTLAYAYTGHAAHDEKPSTVAAGPIGSLDDLGAQGWARALAVQYNDNLYTRAPVFVAYTAMRNYIQEDWGLDRLLRRGVVGPQRLWFAAAVPTVPATLDAYAAFKQRAHALGALPVVRQEPASLLRPGAGEALSVADRAAIAAAPAGQSVAARILAYHANALALSVTCPSPGFLLVTERWSRSWQATVNGQPVPVDGGDFLFRLVPVRAGENVVTMRFNIWWLYPLLALSWGTLAAVLGRTCCFAWRRRRVSADRRDRARPELNADVGQRDQSATDQQAGGRHFIGVNNAAH